MLFSLESDGTPNFVLAGEGWEDTRFADLRKIDGSDTDAALLTVLQEDGDVLSALIPHENAISGPLGTTMRVFGAVDDLPFSQYSDGVSTVEAFRDAIDDILADME